MKRILIVIILAFLCIYFVYHKISNQDQLGYVELDKVEYRGDATVKSYTDEDIEKLLTPFIKDYLERYDANKGTLNAGLLGSAVRSVCKNTTRAKIPCESKDWINLREMANMGVPAALNIFVELDPYFKFHESKDRDLTLQYLKKLSIENTPESYNIMMNLYNEKGLNKNFCETVLEGYEKFGLSFLSTYIQYLHVNSITKKKKAIAKPYMNCLNAKPKVFLKNINTDEAQFMLGLLYLIDIKKSSDVDALQIFEKLYENSKDPIMKYNAGACIGAMRYVDDEELGSSLIKNSMANGLIVVYGSLPNTNMFSDNKVILNYTPIEVCQIFK